jgi:hypothetical protein
MRLPAIAFAVLLMTCATFAGPKGTVPRTSADLYPVHAQADGVSVGVKVLKRDEARKTFVSDVNRCCVVLEIAVYPDNSKPAEISLDHFALRATAAATATKASSPKVVAASLQKNAAGDRDIAVYPTTGIGYSTGNVYDPATGTRRGGGLYTQAGVGVAIGGPGGPGVSDKDRSVMETELSDKGLPEGTTSSAVAGYVYFPVSPKKKADYQLEYTYNGSKIVLPIHIQ